jgi:hypothetical protein
MSHGNDEAWIGNHSYICTEGWSAAYAGDGRRRTALPIVAIEVRSPQWLSNPSSALDSLSTQARRSKIIAPASRSPFTAKTGSMRTPSDSLSEL